MKYIKLFVMLLCSWTIKAPNLTRSMANGKGYKSAGFYPGSDGAFLVDHSTTFGEMEVPLEKLTLKDPQGTLLGTIKLEDLTSCQNLTLPSFKLEARDLLTGVKKEIYLSEPEKLTDYIMRIANGKIYLRDYEKNSPPILALIRNALGHAGGVLPHDLSKKILGLINKSSSTSMILVDGKSHLTVYPDSCLRFSMDSEKKLAFNFPQNRGKRHTISPHFLDLKYVKVDNDDDQTLTDKLRSYPHHFNS